MSNTCQTSQLGGSAIDSSQMVMLCGGTLLLAALATNLLTRSGGLGADVPNARSSHAVATPRGGGAAFVFAALVGLAALSSYASFFGLVIDGLAFGLVTAALACSVIGLIEDVAGLPNRHRFAGEVLVAVLLALAGLRWTSLDLGFLQIELPPSLSVAFTVLWLVWFTNLYNFMDGINCLATLTGLLWAGFFAWFALASGEPFMAGILLVIAGALAGFLPFNFPKARIFMGDVGSLFLGFVFGGVPIYLSEHQTGFGFIHAALMLGPFLFDATITLLRRAAGGERVTEAHRSHAYQRLALAWRNHTPVTLLYGGTTIVCCYVAFIAWQQNRSPMAWVGIMFLILGLMVLQWRYPAK